ncbi:MAG: flagellar filament capping protein FliD, partial [Sulfurihydrogenibium sp.]
ASKNGVSDKNASLGLSSGTLTIHMDGLDYNTVYDGTYSLQTLADAINNTAATYNGNFRASIVDAGTSSNPSYKLVISGTKTGSDNSFTISDTGDLVSSLDINSIQDARNATASINNVDVKSDTNTFTSVEGLSFTVSQTGTATITVNKDKGPLLDTLKNLVNSYNNLVDTVKKETGKGGRLSGEYSLVSVVNGIFRQMDELFKNSLINFDKDTGHISINTSKFDDMYNNNLSTLQNILSTTKDKITNYLKPYTDYNGILDQKIKAYDNQVKNLQNMIDLQTQRINTEIETLKNQFVRMQMLQAQFNDISARIQATFGLQQNKQ